MNKTTTIQQTHGVSAEKWAQEMFGESIGQNPFFNFMGESSNSLIQIKEDRTKIVGDSVTIKILGGGENHEQKIQLDCSRHAVLLRGDMENKRVAFDLRNQAHEALVDWSCDKLTHNIIKSLTDISSDAETHEISLRNTKERLTPAFISRAKRKALLEGPHKLRPMKIMGDNKVEEIFVLFAHPYAVRDLLEDQAFKDVNVHIPVTFGESVLVHGQRYKGMWDGVMIFECEEMPIRCDNIAHSVLCGAQAVAVTYGKPLTYKEDPEYYCNENGFAINSVIGSDKLFRGDVENGIIHLFNKVEDDKADDTAEPTRLEVIDETGRAYVKHDVNIELSYQDDGRTLKIFVKGADDE